MHIYMYTKPQFQNVCIPSLRLFYSSDLPFLTYHSNKLLDNSKWDAKWKMENHKINF